MSIKFFLVEFSLFYVKEERTLTTIFAKNFGKNFSKTFHILLLLTNKYFNMHLLTY